MAEATSNQVADTWAVNCILCEKSLKDNANVIVNSKGIRNYIESSKWRGDPEVGAGLSGRSTITVHETCSETYN